MPNLLVMWNLHTNGSCPGEMDEDGAGVDESDKPIFSSCRDV